MAKLELIGVRKSWDKTEVIHGVDLKIKDGEFVVFVGPSGCGKSTLLRMISGLESITEGALVIGNKEMTTTPPAERGIAMVFQSYALYPNMSVRDNLAYPLEMAKQPKEQIKQKVAQVAKTLHLEPMLDRLPKALSGGQRQRVAIGRAIIREPDIFLFDEPLSNLDAELRLQMRIEIAKLHESLGVTMIYVTHDQLEAMTLADRIVVCRDGKIEQVGAPLEIYHDPDNLFVAGFIGSPKINLLKGEVANSYQGQTQIRVPALGIDSLMIELEAPLQEGQIISIGFRPEHILDAVETIPQQHCFDAPVAFSEHLGHTNYLYLDVGEEDMFVVESRIRDSVANNERVRFAVDPQKALLFDDNGLRLR
ncbi:multiple sugar transport system ATP-binding protein [Vibrio xiamenensis]|uniref:Multiple sugar transport system ATP-binding protein n=1 Tax=Vibrio xiamenensis TaxID=861298 RepID=A0A1G7XXS5_9VIBR|nr:sn-glycerol-3-phosphate ABC transporter ATP-binding protein UgpC [Vibrio xiamenensis]SDG77568.1 multiple sugar transport system ATP-binding protein [Vibrio xiamenensis]SDG88989.1 multiple sugar transport system ATP-binding protein [Vibrio xiamenensis]